MQGIATATGVAVSTVTAAAVGVAAALYPSPVGEGSDQPPRCENEDDCIKLQNEIRKWTQKFNQRAEDLRIDKCNQFNLAFSLPNPNSNCGGNTTWTGHQAQIRDVQRRLMNLIQKALRKGCPIPPGAWSAATSGVPQSPRGM